MIISKYMYQNKYTDDFLKFSGKNYLLKEKALRVQMVEEGVILPLKNIGPKGPTLGLGGVLDSEGRYLIDSASIGKGDTADRFIGKYTYNKEEEDYLDETIFFMGVYLKHWGHFLVDVVYRLWYVLQHPEENFRIAYCANKEEEINGTYSDFFELLDIKKSRLIRIDRPTRVRKIILVQPAYMACDYITQEYKYIFDTLVQKVKDLPLTPYSKIYLSRMHFKEAKKKEIGEKNIERNFANNGFHVLYMEELSLKEQIFYISHCKVMAALSGTLCHNLLFADRDVQMIILNKTHFINTHQVLINQVVGADVYYVDIYKEPYKRFPLSYGGGPFLLVNNKGLGSWFEEKQYVYTKDKVGVKLQNRIKYLHLCLSLTFQQNIKKMYVWLYYKISKNDWLIGFLRNIRIKIKGKRQ